MAEYINPIPDQAVIERTLTESGFTVLTPELWVSPVFREDADRLPGCNVARTTVLAHMKVPVDDLREFNTYSTSIFDRIDPNDLGGRTQAELEFDRLHPYTWQYTRVLGTCSAVTTLDLRQGIEGQIDSREVIIPPQEKILERTFDVTGSLKFALFPSGSSAQRAYGRCVDPIAYLRRAEARRIGRASRG